MRLQRWQKRKNKMTNSNNVMEKSHQCEMSKIHTHKRKAHLIGLIVGHQLVDGSSLGDFQEDGFGLLPALRRSWAHVAEVAGAGALTLAAAVHSDAGGHTFSACIQQAGYVGRIGESPGLFVSLFWLLWRRVTCIWESKIVCKAQKSIVKITFLICSCCIFHMMEDIYKENQS